MKVLVLWLLVTKVAVAFAWNVAPFEVKKLTKESLNNSVITRIHGGNVAEEGKFKFMIITLMKTINNEYSMCSSSLVKPEWVLLAGHCINDPDLVPRNVFCAGGRVNLQFYIEEKVYNFNELVDERKFGLQERRAQKFFIHPHFVTSELLHDIALIKVEKPFKKPLVNTISLSMDRIIQKKTCTILGWGLVDERLMNFELNYATNVLVSTMELGCKYRRNGPFICLVSLSSGIMVGDSGSPLVCDNQIWGVASHYIYEPSTDIHLEEYYTELWHNKEWVISTLNTASITKVAGLQTLIIGACINLWLSKN